MNRREFVSRCARCAGVLSMAGSGSAAVAASGGSVAASRLVPSVNIRDYLSAEAGKISKRIPGDRMRAAEWQREIPRRREQFLEMMGVDPGWMSPRKPPAVVVTGVVEREKYRIEKLHYEALPGVYISGNLYLPRDGNARVPGVLYVCGHAKDQKVYYQAHARKFAELGMVCLIAETIEASELGGYHHGPYREGWWHWYSRGYTPAGAELWNGIRALDLLQNRQEVDGLRLGVTGMSGGGAATWWIAAADQRIKVAAPVCGTASLYSHVHDRTIDGHCDCMWWNNTEQWDMPDVGSLIAPRPLMIASSDKDGIFTIESIRGIHARLRPLYRKLGAGEMLRLVETPGGHSYHPRSRTEIFSWFVRHLSGQNVSPDEVGDMDERPEKQEPGETLKVFVSGVPPQQKVTVLHDEMFRPAKRPECPDSKALAREKEKVRSRLMAVTFRAFPASPPPLDTQVEYEFDEDLTGFRFGFTSEPGWRLSGTFFRRRSDSGSGPIVVVLRRPDEGRWDTRTWISRLPASFAGVSVDVRGVGDTAWGDELKWHVRRAAAWTGRTVASMRVWDALQALNAVRSLPGLSTRPIFIAGRDEMAVVALYAAFLDGSVGSVLLERCPPTQDLPGARDGQDPAIEMLGSLRIADLPQIAGLLFPTALTLIESPPDTFSWAERLYATLGRTDRFRRVASAREIPA